MESGVECATDELRSLFLFESLSGDQLDRLCRGGRVGLFEPVALFAEGEPATCLYVLLDGEIALSKRSGGVDIETIRTTQRGAYFGAWSAFLEEEQTYETSARVTQRSRLFMIDATSLGEFLRTEFPMACHFLVGSTLGRFNQNRIVGPHDRLIQLAHLTAGLTHELNNSAADSLTVAHGLSPLQKSDREEVLGEWLDGRGVDDGWGHPAGVGAGHAGQAVLAARPGPLRRRRPAVAADRHIGDALAHARSGDHGAHRLRRRGAAHPLLSPAELNQVWTNLIDNAVWAMRSNGAAGATLTVRTRRQGECARVEVCDSGPGVPDELKSRVFDPFFTTRPVGEGTGLGLDFAARTVDKHRGSLWVESTPGDTRFIALLPLEAAVP